MRKFKTIDLAYMAIGAVLIAVCSWISLPIGPIPFTLQTFAVFCVVGFLGGKRGLVSIVVYMLLGLIGIPVFSNFTGGFGVLIGKTGGYIIGFIFIALIYWLAEVIFKTKVTGNKMKPVSLIIRFAVLIIGLAVCYAFGTAWFLVVYTRASGPVGVGVALGWCVIPFILPDLAKMVVAVLVAARLKRYLK